MCYRLLLPIAADAFTWEERNVLEFLSALCLPDIIAVTGNIAMLTVEDFAPLVRSLLPTANLKPSLWKPEILRVCGCLYAAIFHVERACVFTVYVCVSVYVRISSCQLRP
jgi:hypothetical protein